jgi:hypothetical protein
VWSSDYSRALLSLATAARDGREACKAAHRHSRVLR